MQLEPLTIENTFVWVHTWRGRDGQLDPCLSSIEASDIGRNYSIFRQPDDERDRARFHISAWRRAATQGKPWVLRLEDDVRVHRHLMQRLDSWGATGKPQFGLGWLGYAANILTDRFRVGRDGEVVYRNDWQTCHSFGVLAHTSFVPRLTAGMEALRAKFPCGAADLLLSEATVGAGKLVYLHVPGLVTTDPSLKSSLNNTVFPADYYSFLSE